MRPSTISRLTRCAHEFAPIAMMDGEFKVSDIDMPSQKAVARVKELNKWGLVKAVGQEYNPRCGTRINIWDWTHDKSKEIVLEASQDRDDDLPCGHRPHVANSSHHDGYSCRYCRIDSDNKTIPVIEPKYSRETVKNRL